MWQSMLLLRKVTPCFWYQLRSFAKQQTFTLLAEDVCLGNLNVKHQTFQPKTNFLSDISAWKKVAVNVPQETIP
jgi:hypothetical protein